jgi:tetratricopeptide (TPR) repeat protein
MFEMGREIRKLFAPDAPRDGLSFGDAGLLEMLDLNLLTAEARSADTAAGRIGARDRGQRLLEAATVWRELARRTGDASALRKAAALAEDSAVKFKAEGRSKGAARARCEQALVAIAGARLFGEDGLNAAAEYVLAEVGPGSDLARGVLVGLTVRGLLTTGSAEEARTAATAWDAPIAAIQAHGKEASAELAVRRLRCERAEFLTGCGSRLHAPELFRLALADLEKAGAGLDARYRPISHAHVLELKGLALAGLGEAAGDATPLLEAVELLAGAVEAVDLAHSPVDWARLHAGLAQALMALGEAGDCEAAFDRAIDSLGKAQSVLEGCTGLALRAAVAQNRAGALVRRAEMLGDIHALDEAEAVFRCELGGMAEPFDPIAWAVVQMNLARIYRARAVVAGRPGEARERAGEALAVALDVFTEHGLRTLASMAGRELDQLREASIPKII